MLIAVETLQRPNECNVKSGFPLGDVNGLREI